MQTFKVNRKIEVVCNSEDTRYGFRHLATLLYNGREVDRAKCCYYNRTWERYTYESVLKKLAEATTALSDKEKKLFSKYITNFQENNSFLGTVAMVAKMGDVFGRSQKESNDWKARMLKAGLEGRGLIMPDNWEELDEGTKQARLDEAIKQLA